MQQISATTLYRPQLSMLRQRRARLTQRPRERTRQTPRQTEKLTPQPPHHLRESRTLPRQIETLATRPAISHDDRRAPTPTRRLRRDLQPPPPTPTQSNAGNHLHHTQIYTANRRPNAPHRHRPNPQRNHIMLLIDGYNVRIIHAATGELIRTLTINPQHRYHGTGKPVGGPRRPYVPATTRNPNPDRGSDFLPMSRDITKVELGGIEPLRGCVCRTCSRAIVPGHGTFSGVRQ